AESILQVVVDRGAEEGGSSRRDACAEREPDAQSLLVHSEKWMRIPGTVIATNRDDRPRAGHLLREQRRKLPSSGSRVPTTQPDLRAAVQEDRTIDSLLVQSDDEHVLVLGLIKRDGDNLRRERWIENGPTPVHDCR